MWYSPPLLSVPEYATIILIGVYIRCPIEEEVDYCRFLLLCEWRWCNTTRISPRAHVKACQMELDHALIPIICGP